MLVSTMQQKTDISCSLMYKKLKHAKFHVSGSMQSHPAPTEQSVPKKWNPVLILWQVPQMRHLPEKNQVLWLMCKSSLAKN